MLRVALEPGVPTEIEIELEATSWIFEPGHRVRLSLAGSDWPNIWPPPSRSAARRSSARASSSCCRCSTGPSPLPAPALPPTTGKDTHAPDADDEQPPIVWRLEDDQLGARGTLRHRLRLELRGAVRRRGSRSATRAPSASRRTIRRSPGPAADRRTASPGPRPTCERRRRSRSAPTPRRTTSSSSSSPRSSGAEAGRGGVLPRAALRAHDPAAARLSTPGAADSRVPASTSSSRMQAARWLRRDRRQRRAAPGRSPGSGRRRPDSADGTDSRTGTCTGFGVSPVRICGVVC